MIRYLVYRPIAVCVVTLSLTVLGGLAFFQLPVSLLPNIPVPEITVQVSYPSASARELQRTIEQPIRNQLLQVTHLDDIQTVVQDGLAVLTLRFGYGTNVRLAYLETNEKIDAILDQLPRDLDRPKVIKAGAGDIPVFNLNVLPGPNYREDFLALSEFSENVLKRRIEQLPEVALVDATGLSQPEVLVQADAGRLASLGLTEQQLAEALKQANLQPGNFSVREGPYQYNIRFSSVLQTVQDVGNVVISVGGVGLTGPLAQNDPRVSYFADNVLTEQDAYTETPRRLIALRELATVSLRERPLRGIYAFNSKRGICLAIIKQNDAQLLHLRRELDKLLGQFQKDYPQLEFTLSQDQTELLDISINNFISNLLTGALLTFGMVFLFMRDWRLTLLIGLVIPVSIAITFLGFFLLKLSINIVSLAGLVLGMGEIVDSAIIILENVEEKRDEGLSVIESCAIGANEVITPLFTSVLTNSAVFLPLLLLSGLAGALFFDQAVSVSLALGISLLCSYTLIPVVYSLIYHRQNIKVLLPPTLFTRWLEWGYNVMFSAAFRFKWMLVLGLVGLLSGAILMGVLIEKRGMPNVSHNELEVFIDWNEPLTVAENQRRTDLLTKSIRPFLIYISAFTGQQQFLLNRQFQQTESETLLSLRTDSDRNSKKVALALTQQLRQQYPLAMADFRPARNVFEQLFGTTEPPLRLKLYNTQGQQPLEPELTGQIARQLAQIGLPSNPIGEQSQLKVRLRSDKLLLYNVADESVVQTLKTVFNNYPITNIQSEQRFIPLMFSGPLWQSNWQNTFVYNRQHQAIPLHSLIEILPYSDYTIFYADRQGPFIPFDYEVNNQTVDDVQERVDAMIRNVPGVLTSWTGHYFRDSRYLSELLGIVAVAIALLFCILTAQFESTQQPLIVLLIIGLGIAGAIWSLYLFGNSINIMSAIGMVVLVGLLDNDSILKIDTMNRSSSPSLIEGIRLAGLRRLKSQIMTFLTTVLGLLPVLFSGGLGSELQQPLAQAVIGGMSVGVLASWTVIPLVYWRLFKHQQGGFAN
ncbi:AcrB/AcrD/AcrF family protein [Spirosoma sp. HMF4905]|uniref:AcrB/AcrD/AcrF family protein n=1 Tax=Spirosoma arboris TaxID=2682092 RepID=A0A7K1SHW6_9BACT|nr:efflux RND transporter permease subunit [Spirosoma arboris]MVM33410.1 AcrB/AcrD/AcrF family protein [Spirosoma arboris]